MTGLCLINIACQKSKCNSEIKLQKNSVNVVPFCLQTPWILHHHYTEYVTKSTQLFLDQWEMEVVAENNP